MDAAAGASAAPPAARWCSSATTSGWPRASTAQLALPALNRAALRGGGMNAPARAGRRAAPGTAACTLALRGAVDRAVHHAAARRRAHARTTCARASRSRCRGTDLIVGARTGAVQLMLYAVFRIGGATNNIRMDSVRGARRSTARWPGRCRSRWATRTAASRCWAPRPTTSSTSATATGSRWRWPQGRAFSGTLDGLYDAVLGAEVAQALGYRLGQRITLSHGSGGAAGQRTRRQALHRGRHPGAHRHAGGPHRARQPGRRIEAIHLDWAGGAPLPGLTHRARAGAQVRPRSRSRSPPRWSA